MFERLDSRVDVLTQVLEAVRLGSALSSRTELTAPWALHFGADEHRAGFHVVTAGTCWVTVDGAGVDGVAAAVPLATGDVIVLPHGTGHTLGDRPDRPALEFLDLVGALAPGERIALPSGGDHGADGDGERTVLLCGSYSFAADGMNPLLRGLPALLHIPAVRMRGGALESAVRLLTGESDGLHSGSALVVDRLVDLLFVYALRAWLSLQEQAGADGADGGARSWFGALQDPVVGPAVRAVHDDPSHPWTVELLAQRSGMSRAPFARRFRQAVGEPPLAYVTRWRMTMAEQLLARGERVASVAPQVGYDNEFAFAKAFKRVRGIAPGQHRRRHSPFSKSLSDR